MIRMYSKADVEKEILLMLAVSNSMKDGRSMVLYRDLEDYYRKWKRRGRIASGAEDIMFI